MGMRGSWAAILCAHRACALSPGAVAGAETAQGRKRSPRVDWIRREDFIRAGSSLKC